MDNNENILELCEKLVLHDGDISCPFCKKDSWGDDKHDVDCPMSLAYKLLEILKQ